MPNKAIFLDRDDTLIEDPGYISHPDQVRLISGIAKPLIDLQSMGYKLVVVTNQSAVARGIISEKVLSEVHDRLTILLSEKGVQLDAIYYCPFHPDGIIPQYRRESENRKPSPGMLLAAAKEHDIELNQSWVIGNIARDIEAGQRAGCKTILIEKKPRTIKFPTFKKDIAPAADYTAVNMKEAVNIIKKHYRLETVKPSRFRFRSLAKHNPQPLPQPPPQHSSQAAPVATAAPSAPAAGPTRHARRTQLQQPEPQSPQQSQETGEQQVSQQAIENFLREMKNIQRTDSFSEFSLARLFAGILQTIVFFCLLISGWLLMEPNRKSDLILITLGFAMVLQIMTLSFYIMQRRK